MNPIIKAKWVAALRSGEYKQTKKQLRNGDAFCCLGVLCNLHAQAHPEIAAKQVSPGRYMGRNDLLPMRVMQWAGLDTTCGEFPNPVLSKNEYRYDLADLNDSGASFKALAKVIETQL